MANVADIIIFGGQSNMEGQTEVLSECEVVAHGRTIAVAHGRIAVGILGTHSTGDNQRVALGDFGDVLGTERAAKHDRDSQHEYLLDGFHIFKLTS